MKQIKAMLISALFLIAYIFLFITDFGWILTLILMNAIIVLVFIPWDGWSIFTIIKSIKENQIMLNIRDEENFLPESSKKIAVMLSGGVDSSVVLKLLLDKGYKVEAFFMRNWDSTTNLELNNILTKDEICQQEEDYEDAKKVAKHFGVKLNRVDFVKEYWDDVFSTFLKEIDMGLTPNPDILCNRHIKFGRFVEYINKNHPKFEYVATGHYAKIVERDSVKFMAQAKDPVKDQTYFLAEIDRMILDKVVFPLADLDKSEIRKIAKEAEVPVSDKKDSTGICFIGQRNFPEFISNYLDEKPGDIIDEETGIKVGEHKGALFYTIGQRKGLNLGGFEKPYFISKKDIEKNIVYVSSGKDNSNLMSKIITAKNFNWLIEDSLVKDGQKIKFKTRHSASIYDGIFENNDDGTITVVSKKEIKAVTPGQELVVYINGICIGGGQIK